MIQSPSETEMFVEIAGSSMKVAEKGQGDVVVLAHSYLWDAEMWRPQIDVLARHYRVIIPNLWGHGGSGPLPEGTRDLRDVALHHLELLDRLGISQFSMIGHSVGGMWGTELALQAPERVRSLVLISTDVSREPEMARKRYFAMLEAVEATHAIPAAILQEVVGMFFSPYVASWAPQLLWNFRSRLATWDTDRLLDSVVPIGRMIFGRRDALADLSRLSMRKLVMHGTEDIPRPIDDGRRTSKALGCDLIELSGAGHTTPLEVSHDVTRHLLAFLGDVHRGGRPIATPAKASASVGSVGGDKWLFDMG